MDGAFSRESGKGVNRTTGDNSHNFASGVTFNMVSDRSKPTDKDTSHDLSGWHDSKWAHESLWTRIGAHEPSKLLPDKGVGNVLSSSLPPIPLWSVSSDTTLKTAHEDWKQNLFNIQDPNDIREIVRYLGMQHWAEHFPGFDASQGEGSSSFKFRTNSNENGDSGLEKTDSNNGHILGHTQSTDVRDTSSLHSFGFTKGGSGDSFDQTVDSHKLTAMDGESLLSPLKDNTKNDKNHGVEERGFWIKWSPGLFPESPDSSTHNVGFIILSDPDKLANSNAWSHIFEAASKARESGGFSDESVFVPIHGHDAAEKDEGNLLTVGQLYDIRWPKKTTEASVPGMSDVKSVKDPTEPSKIPVQRPVTRIAAEAFATLGNQSTSNSVSNHTESRFSSVEKNFHLNTQGHTTATTNSNNNLEMFSTHKRDNQDSVPSSENFIKEIMKVATANKIKNGRILNNFEMSQPKEPFPGGPGPQDFLNGSWDQHGSFLGNSDGKAKTRTLNVSQTNQVKLQNTSPDRDTVSLSKIANENSFLSIFSKGVASVADSVAVSGTVEKTGVHAAIGNQSPNSNASVHHSALHNDTANNHVQLTSMWKINSPPSVNNAILPERLSEMQNMSFVGTEENLGLHLKTIIRKRRSTMYKVSEREHNARKRNRKGALFRQI